MAENFLNTNPQVEAGSYSENPSNDAESCEDQAEWASVQMIWNTSDDYLRSEMIQQLKREALAFKFYAKDISAIASVALTIIA